MPPSSFQTAGHEPGDPVYHHDQQHQDATDLADPSRLRHHRQGTEDLLTPQHGGLVTPHVFKFKHQSTEKLVAFTR
ncbi:hypothetical protein L917_01792 [Phytophthora nicotianae]|uniref:Uncharacterized protein n=1 Tax=Phytophthora nicotianae TaxID=4792 RepID=W2LYH1_PHYNI|nr:hypothetical protein L917_01792 [Phytophthora nicotianae]